MTKTERREPFNYYTKERKPFRKALQRVWRHRAKRALHTEREPERERRTSGWLTH